MLLKDIIYKGMETVSVLYPEEEQLMKWHDMPHCTEKFKSQHGLYSFGIKLFTWLGIEKRIRK